MYKNMTPKYAEIKIKNSRKVQKKVEKLSERLWLKMEIFKPLWKWNLYGKLNTFNKELYKRYLELYKIFSFIEIEEMLHAFGEDYVNRRLKNKNEKLQMKSDKLLKQKINTDNKRNRKDNFAERVVNLTKITFTEDEQKYWKRV